MVKLESLKRWNEERGLWCEKGVQVLVTTVGAFAAFGLMTIAISTDYWLYTRAFICNTTNLTAGDDGPPHRGGGPPEKKDPGGLTHSGLWRICCLEGRRPPPPAASRGPALPAPLGTRTPAWPPPGCALRLPHAPPGPPSAPRPLRAPPDPLACLSAWGPASLALAQALSLPPSPPPPSLRPFLAPALFFPGSYSRPLSRPLS